MSALFVPKATRVPLLGDGDEVRGVGGINQAIVVVLVVDQVGVELAVVNPDVSALLSGC